jgi:hypothetical protein
VYSCGGREAHGIATTTDTGRERGWTEKTNTNPKENVMSHIQAEINLALFNRNAAREAKDGATFRFWRRMVRILQSVEMANNATLLSVSYESEDQPQTEIEFAGTAFAAQGIGRAAKQTVQRLGGDEWLIIVSDEIGRYCGLPGYKL